MIITFLLCGKLIFLFYALKLFPTCPSYKSSDVRIKCTPFKHFMHVCEIQLYTFFISWSQANIDEYWLKGPAFAWIKMFVMFSFFSIFCCPTEHLEDARIVSKDALFKKEKESARRTARCHITLEKSSKNYVRCESEPSQAPIHSVPPPHLFASCDGGFSTWWGKMCESPWQLATATRQLEGGGWGDLRIDTIR